MLTKGNIKAQITATTQNSKVEKVYCNRLLILIIKFIKIVYFTGRKKWTLKIFFMISWNIWRLDLWIKMQNNSKFTTDEFVKNCSDCIVDRFLFYIVGRRIRYPYWQKLWWNWKLRWSYVDSIHVSLKKNLLVCIS